MVRRARRRSEFSGTTGPSGTDVLVNFSASGLSAWSQASGNVFTNVSVGFDLTKAYQWNVQATAYDPAVPTQVYNPLGGANSVGVVSN